MMARLKYAFETVGEAATTEGCRSVPSTDAETSSTATVRRRSRRRRRISGNLSQSMVVSLAFAFIAAAASLVSFTEANNAAGAVAGHYVRINNLRGSLTQQQQRKLDGEWEEDDDDDDVGSNNAILTATEATEDPFSGEASTTFATLAIVTTTEAPPAEAPLAEETPEEAFPPNCSWECYLENNPDLVLGHSEKVALRHWTHHGEKEGRDCTCKGGIEEETEKNVEEGDEEAPKEEEALPAIGGIDWEIPEDQMDQEEVAAEEAEAAKEASSTTTSTLMASTTSTTAEAEESFPPGCTWECYIANNPDVKHSHEESALKHWLKHGKEEGRDCSCKDDEEDEVVEVVDAAEDVVVDGEEDDEEDVIEPAVVVEEEEAEPVVAAAAASTEENKDIADANDSDDESLWPEGCSYECYITRYTDLLNLSEEQAFHHWSTHTEDERRDCHCVDVEDVEVEDGEAPVVVGDAVEDVTGGDGEVIEPVAAVEEKEVTEPVAAAVAASTEDEDDNGDVTILWPEGCSYECYVARYPDVAELSEEKAAEHYFERGSLADRDCSCSDDTEEAVDGDGDVTDVDDDESEPTGDDDDVDVWAESIVAANAALPEDDNEDTSAASNEKEDDIDAVAAPETVAATPILDEKSPFPLGCSWECYLANNPDLEIPPTEAAAEFHYENFGMKKGYECLCPSVAIAPKEEDGLPQELEEDQDNTNNVPLPSSEDLEEDQGDIYDSSIISAEAEEIILQIEQVEEQLDELNHATGDVSKSEVEDLKMEEEELLEEAIEEEELEKAENLGTNDSLNDQSMEGLQDEIKGIEESIQEIKNEDDDGQFVEAKEDVIEDLLEIEEEAVEQLEDEVKIENEIISLNDTLQALKAETAEEEDVGIPFGVMDPSLTMDWTTLNPPGMEGGIILNGTESLGAAAANMEESSEDSEFGTTKEAESETFNMDSEPERTKEGADDNDATGVVAGDAKESESESDTMETELDRTDNPAIAVQAVVEGNVASELTNETEVVLPPDDEETVTEEQGEGESEEGSSDVSETSSPIENVTTAAPTTTPTSQKVTTSAPTSSPTSVATTSSPSQSKVATSAPTQGSTTAPTEGKTTSSPTEDAATISPTVKYIEPVDEALDPVENEEANENESFENGEAPPQNDDEKNEEPSPPSGDGGEDWSDDNTDHGSSSYREEYREEEKKLGGWLSFASIILLIYTAYQMSENPDGICASLCRLVITVVGCVIKIMLIPFKYIMGGGRPSGGHYMATPDYRDPYGSRHMELT